MTTLSAEWQTWVRDNLARGCNETQLIASMAEAGIDPVAAGMAVLQAMSGTEASIASGPVTQAYTYSSPRMPQVGSVIQTSDRDVRVSMRMGQPVVALLDNVLSFDECDQLIDLARMKLQRSTIVDPTNGTHKVIADRGSSGTHFAVNENAFIASLDTRIAELMHWPVENGEGLQILNYQVGGEYKPHFDYFPPEQVGSGVHLAKGGQRVSTLILYLNDVERGGETIFPSIHLTVVPKRGSAIYFEYCNASGQIDPSTLHGGAPVLSGEKWIATKWMRQRKYG
ncbi:2-oxoglutarate-dependent dioxygenase [Rhodoferax lacus]|uniref:2-oxoglutarate-dependent dioxygenase n=1 Tax=Rhodoferax lacus TaxID=2184758 RepID=A0A3E1RFV0_9BURK|nr:2OG-Fe(II) oxygenase [Rhodoferax lacus]RFO98248.1 2-oxoglutarate-dependent dioxygenase [Rhodoferax lacus]